MRCSGRKMVGGKKGVVTINIPDIMISFMDYLTHTVNVYKSRSQIARLAIKYQLEEDQRFLKTAYDRMEEGQ